MLLSVWLTLLLTFPSFLASQHHKAPSGTQPEPPPSLASSQTDISTTFSRILQLSRANFNSTLQAHELVFVNFYADWCVFSARLSPIFETAAVQLAAAHPAESSVVFARVDCMVEEKLAATCGITKFPTLQLYKHGRPLRQEYRGQRSVEALITYIEKQMKVPLKTIVDIIELDAINPKRRSVIGFFGNRTDQGVGIFELLADRYRGDCDFYARFGPKLENVSYTQRMPTIVYRPDSERTHAAEEVFLDSIASPSDLENWLYRKCVPLVREVDFNNVEEIIEQGLPLLVLFHMPEDVTSVKDFKSIVEMELLSCTDCGVFSFVTVNGVKFQHSIIHMGKTIHDMPLIAIDSLKFMYPYVRFSDMYIPGHLKGFIRDFSSRRQIGSGQKKNAIEQENFSSPVQPLSSFKDLGPSKHRYTLVGHDEL